MLHEVLIKIMGLVFIVKCSEAARILSYQPVPYDSHQSVLHVLTEELARQGHQLVVLTAKPRKQPIENITEFDVHNISYSLWEKGWNELTKHRDVFGFPDSLETCRMATEIMEPIYESQLRHPQMQALIMDEDERFDLVIVDAVVSVVQIGNMLSDRFGAPLLIASAFTIGADVLSLVGAETHYSFYPDWSSPMPTASHVSNWTFLQTVYSFYNFLKLKWSLTSLENVQNVFGEKKDYVNMLFLNVQHLWDSNRPVPIGSVLYMSGLHLKAPRGLPQNFEIFLGESKHGVVIVTFGSKLRMSTLPARTLRIMTDAFSQLPYNFMCEWDADEMPNKPRNVRLEKSLPINDLLHNSNVRALISHAGLLSIYEAINARVPLLSFPIFSDHWLNTQQYELHGIGIRLNIDDLNGEEFKNAIVAVVEDKKYRDNIDRLSRIFSDRRESPLRGAARLVRRLTARGAHLLRSPLADATLAHFYMLDLLLAATICVLLASAAIVYAVKRFS